MLRDIKCLIMPALFLFIATLASVAFQGFNFPTNNNVFHVPIILDYALSSEGPNDIFHRSLDRYVSGFWPFLSLFANEDNIFVLFLGFHIAVRFLTVFLIWRIAILLGGNSSVSILFVCFIMFFKTFLSFSPVGKNEILIHYLTHSQVVIPLILGSWWLLLERRFLVATAIVGFAFNINALVAIWASLVSGIVMIICMHREEPKRIILMAVMMIGIFLLTAAPTIIWILKSLTEIVPYEPFSYWEYLRAYYPNHSFVDVQWHSFATMGLAILTIFVSLNRIGSMWSRDKRELLMSLLFAYTCIFLCGAILPYLTDSRLLLNLFPLRMDAYIIIIWALIVLSWCINSFREADSLEKAYSLIALFSLINGNLPLLLTTLALSDHRSSRPARFKHLFLILLLAVGGLHVISGNPPILQTAASRAQSAFFLLLQSGVIAYFISREHGSADQSLLFIALSAMCLAPEISNPLMLTLIASVYIAVFFYVVQERFHWTMVLLSVVSVCIVASSSLPWLLIVLASVLMPVLSIYIVPFVEKHLFVRLSQKPVMLFVFYVIFVMLGAYQMGKRGDLSANPDLERASVKLQLWARNNTPPHTVYLPVDIEGFSTLSRRPVWIDWKIGAMVMWAPETYDLWSTRWNQLKQISSVADAQQLAQNERIEYVVFNRDKIPTNNVPASCIVYCNEKYWIMQLCPALQNAEMKLKK
jgi:hypothetical protein